MWCLIIILTSIFKSSAWFTFRTTLKSYLQPSTPKIHHSWILTNSMTNPSSWFLLYLLLFLLSLLDLASFTDYTFGGQIPYRVWYGEVVDKIVNTALPPEKKKYYNYNSRYYKKNHLKTVTYFAHMSNTELKSLQILPDILVISITII